MASGDFRGRPCRGETCGFRFAVVVGGKGFDGGGLLTDGHAAKVRNAPTTSGDLKFHRRCGLWFDIHIEVPIVDFYELISATITG